MVAPVGNDRLSSKHDAKDAGDLLLYIEHYLECGNQDRAFNEHMDVFEAEGSDYAAAGARLLGCSVTILPRF